MTPIRFQLAQANIARMRAPLERALLDARGFSAEVDAEFCGGVR